jgi:SNF2 family DNA or RNA helicase
VARFEKAQDSDGQQNSLLDLKRTLLFHQPHAFLLRRTKSDVAELPPKTVIPLYCDMSESEIAAHRTLLKALRDDGRPSRYLSALQKFVQLYQHPAMLTDNPEDLSVGDLVSQSSKLRVLLSQLHEIRKKREKVIVFARLRTMQAILSKVLEAELEIPVRIINGETKLRGAGSLNASGQKTRNAILNDFRSRPGFNVLILSPFVAGIGLTIIEANHVVHYGRWWNPAVESQATDRAYRIGQTREVSVYLPILRDPSRRVDPTFDERLHLLMEKKQRLAEDFLRPLPAEDELGGELFTDLNAEALRR